MKQGNYQTVFEIGLGSFPWARVLHPLIGVAAIVAIGLFLMLFLRSKQIALVMGAFGVLFGSLFILPGLVVFVPNFVKLRSAYVSGRSSIVEGVVENFRPAPTIGPAREFFSVSGVLFSYNALDDTPCFHNAPLHRGPIRDGSDVRIYYDEGCIQRVDLRGGEGGPSKDR
jgi:hypothetical protein